MNDIIALLDYFKKLQRIIDNADLNIFKFRVLKKTRVDDILVCTLTKLPDCFKKAMKKRLQIDKYPSVSCFSRLSKIMKKPFVLNKDYYIVNYDEANMMLKAIRQNLEKDIRALEQEEG